MTVDAAQRGAGRCVGNAPMDAIVSLFGALSLPENEVQAERLTTRMLGAAEARIVSFLNAHAVNIAVQDVAFAGALLRSDYLLRDGSGVKLGCLLLGVAPGPNLNGTDLIPKIIAHFKEHRIAVFGAEPRWLEEASQRWRAQGVRDLIARDGFQSADVYAALLKASRPELVVLGMGMPKQELLAEQLRLVARAEGIPTLIVNGGAIIDFTAGKVGRAPVWMRKLGIEWVYRLLTEPGRLARRYLLGNPLFLWRVLLTRIARGPHPILVKDRERA